MGIRSGYAMATGEYKEAFKARLKAEGRWREFIHRREELKAGGLVGRWAWFEASKSFPIRSEESDNASVQS